MGTSSCRTAARVAEKKLEERSSPNGEDSCPGMELAFLVRGGGER
jgi:hypothetical protein